MALLDVRDLSIEFRSERGPVLAVDRLSFSVQPGEIVAVVGESGSGKSVTAMSILRLLDERHARIGGSIALDGRELLTLPDAAMRKVRGGEIGMVFQEPSTALNPVLKIGTQMVEALRRSRGLNWRAARRAATELLDSVSISAPERRIDEYPHQLSGGMRQRVMIAMALSGDPQLLIADEPTTALDVTVQAQILDLLRVESRRRGLAVLLITHDLGVVADLADRVIVVYAGRKVEDGSTRQIFRAPLHPYTRGLQAATRRLGQVIGDRRSPEPLVEIMGNVPSFSAPAPGCSFAPRCAHACGGCASTQPELVELEGHLVACTKAGRAA